MKAWLAENGMETETLSKKAVAELMKMPLSALPRYLPFVSSLPKARSKIPGDGKRCMR